MQGFGWLKKVTPFFIRVNTYNYWLILVTIWCYGYEAISYFVHRTPTNITLKKCYSITLHFVVLILMYDIIYAEVVWKWHRSDIFRIICDCRCWNWLSSRWLKVNLEYYGGLLGKTMYHT